MPEARPDAEEGEDEEEVGELDALVAEGDAAGLLALAKAHRTGSVGKERSMKLCHDAYTAAASLGSAEASYALGLFAMQGGLGAQDWKEGAAHLRTAAERGSLPAKMYLANMYELGIHYAKDPGKADVWYRNCARQAQIKDAVETEEYAIAMAEIGSAREYLILVEAKALKEEERERLERRARMHGYQLRMRAASEVVRSESFLPPQSLAKPVASAATQKPATTLEELEAKASKPKPTDEAQKKPKPKESAKPAKADGSGVTFALGMVAFLYALVFVATAAGAGYALTEGAKVAIAKHGALPLIGKRVDAIMPATFFLLAFVPQFLFYKPGGVMKSLVAGGVTAGLGWVAWGTGEGMFLPHRMQQTAGFGVAGFLAALLVVGVLGGAKAKKVARRPSVTLKRDEDEDED